MKIEEQVLSREQMKHLQELGVDTSDASLCWVAGEDTDEGEWNLCIPNNFLLPYNIPTYTIGDLIEKLPKHFYIKEASIFMGALNGSGAFEVWYDKAPKSHKMDGNIKNALYKLLCWVAQKHKKLLEVKNEKEYFT